MKKILLIIILIIALSSCSNKVTLEPYETNTLTKTRIFYKNECKLVTNISYTDTFLDKTLTQYCLSYTDDDIKITYYFDNNTTLIYHKESKEWE